MVTRKRIGEILLATNRITQEQLDEALKEARSTGQRLGTVLTAHRYITFDDLGRAVAEQFEVPYEPLTNTTPQPDALQLIPGNSAKGFMVLPIAVDDEMVVVAMANPDDLEALDWLQATTGRRVEPTFALAERIERAIAYYYGVASEGTGEVSEIDDTHDLDQQSVESMRRASQETPIIQLVNDIIAECTQLGASDIHFEPQRGSLDVRIRVDGVLRKTRALPTTLQPAVISRLKLMADIDISERRLPQDGRISIKTQDRRIDIRVNTLPTRWGERVVLRILDRDAGVKSLEQLHLSERNEQAFRTALRQPHGLVLVTGPTGSGKSTTLYAALQAVKDEGINILTCEDPIEYELAGISQTQVHERIGMTFSNQLRAALRQDPDVILVGEIRDLETAEVASRAAMTGHLVFSTLHTNDAPSAIPRLIDMEVEPYLINSALICIMAQRLVRTLCKECRAVDTVTSEESAAFGIDPISVVWRPAGCSTCNNTGYRGRMAIHELMLVTEEIRMLTLRRAAGTEIREAALRAGMVSMAEDLRDKILGGHTSPTEGFRFIRTELLGEDLSQAA